MENNERIKYTKEGFKALVDELDQLKNVKMLKVKEDLAYALSLGDFSENSELDEARDEQAKVVSRIAELEYLIENADVINEDELESGVVNLGCTVKVFDYDLEEEAVYRLVGSNQANAMEGLISDLSPLGSAMMGAKVGEDVLFETPSGLTLKVKILDVTRTRNN